MKRKLSKIYTPYIILFFTFIIPLINTLFASPIEITAPSYMVKVIDGDSLEINSIRIRLIGIDAPEYTQTCKTATAQTYDCGQNSKEYLKNLIKNKTITCIPQETDQYDRKLCLCYANEININQTLVKNGYAVAYYSDEYKQEEIYAKSKKLGIWNGDFIHPHLFRTLHKK